MSRYINWSITSLAACLSRPLWLLSFLVKVLRRYIGEMGRTIAPSSSLSSWTLCTCSPLDSSIFLMLVYTGKDTTWDFLIYFNLHYRCTEHWLLFIVLWCSYINLKESSSRNCISSSRIKSDTFSIKHVTELDVFRVVTESGPNPDYIIQDTLTAPSAPPPIPSQPVCRFRLRSIGTDSWIPLGMCCSFVPAVCYTCWQMPRSTGPDRGRSRQIGVTGGAGGLRRAVPWQTASELLSVCASGVSWCLCVWFQPVSTERVCKASVSSAHAGNPNAPVASADIHALNYSWRDSRTATGPLTFELSIEILRAPEIRVGCIKQTNHMTASASMKILSAL